MIFGVIFIPQNIEMCEVMDVERRCGEKDDERGLLSILCTLLWVFLLLGMVYRLTPGKKEKTVFPLLSGVVSRLDAAAEELKAGSPIRDAAQAFLEVGIAHADSN